ncbi:patatin-like phospholipase family protein [Caldalkalibacillus salinus]|uniref:patatin-like phospholipase family protein n=1 Tax=Caldalkalibacillus salinus TaxID=2803787 RepID=UPI00192366B3|nr:patatin family protein [Caldalkalibacillus salinus]
MEQTGLVLEGGGMRGLYTAGVLEYFMEQDLYFPYVIGVSAGACMAASYLSRQKGRNKKVNIGLANHPEYLSYRNLWTKRQLFGMDFLFDEIPNNIIPFDFDTFQNAEETFVVGTTDCETGEPVYYTKREHGEHMLKIIRASSSLPFVAPAVEYDGKSLLDGGIIDPIPLQKSQKDGNTRHVVIMTKAEGFTRKRSRLASLSRLFYRQHPKIGESLENRHERYNQTLKDLYHRVDQGEVFLIQPSREVPVSRIERDQTRLTALYELGYEDAKAQYASLQAWLKQPVSEELI